MSEVGNYATYLNHDISNRNYNIKSNQNNIKIPIKDSTKNNNKAIYYQINKNKDITNSQDQNFNELKSKKPTKNYLSILQENNFKLIIDKTNLYEIFLLFKTILSMPSAKRASICIDINKKKFEDQFKFILADNSIAINSKKENFINNNNVKRYNSNNILRKENFTILDVNSNKIFEETYIKKNNSFSHKNNVDKNIITILDGLNKKNNNDVNNSITNAKLIKGYTFNNDLYNCKIENKLLRNYDNVDHDELQSLFYYKYHKKNNSFDFPNNNENSLYNLFNPSNEIDDNNNSKIIENNLLKNKNKLDVIYKQKSNTEKHKEKSKINNKLIANNMEIKVDDVKIKNSDYINKNDFIPSLSPKLTKEKIIFQKINELNSETLKFKEERNKITALKFEYEKLQKQLLNDIEDLNIKKEEFEKYKITEIEKIKRKKNMISNENNSNKNANINFNIKNQNLLLESKRDKEIIKILRGQISSLENILRLKEDEIKLNSYMRDGNKIKSRINIYKRNNFNYQNSNGGCFVNNSNFFSKNNIGQHSIDILNTEKSIDKKKVVNAKIKGIDKKKIDDKKNSKCRDKKENSVSLDKYKKKNFSLNFTNNSINTKSTKNYFNNRLKKKVLSEKFMNISYTNNHTHNKSQSKKIFNKIGLKVNSKENTIIGHNHIQNSGNSLDKSNRFSKEEQQIFYSTDRNLSVRKKPQKIKLEFNPQFQEILEDKNDYVNINNENEINDEDIDILNFSGSVFNAEKTTEKRSKLLKQAKDPRKSNLINNNNASKKKIKISKKELNIIKSNKNNNNNLMNNRNNNHDFNKSAKARYKFTKNKINDKKVVNKSALNLNNCNTKDNSSNLKSSFNNILSNNNVGSNYSAMNIKTNSNKMYNTNILDGISKNFETLQQNNYGFIIPEKYKNSSTYKLLKEVKSENGKIINIFTKNKKEIVFKSGVRKEVFDDGYQLVHFPNGDLKQSFPSGKVVYYFCEAKTVQTTFKDGVNIFKFSNNQIEKHCPDGSKFIIFPNGTKRRVSKNGREENYGADGIIVKNGFEIYDIEENVSKSNNEDESDLMSKNKNVFMSYLDIEQDDDDDD